jgi:hypothetical protein
VQRLRAAAYLRDRLHPATASTGVPA